MSERRPHEILEEFDADQIDDAQHAVKAAGYIGRVRAIERDGAEVLVYQPPGPMERILGRLPLGEPVPTAGCPRDRTPLIATIAFPKAEFYCLECGGHFGFLDPVPLEPTPEINKQMEALQAEWDEHVAGKIIVGDRIHYSKPDRQAEHDAAMEWLKERAK